MGHTSAAIWSFGPVGCFIGLYVVCGVQVAGMWRQRLSSPALKVECNCLMHAGPLQAALKRAESHVPSSAYREDTCGERALDWTEAGVYKL